jgi:hypothetical protein
MSDPQGWYGYLMVDERSIRSGIRRQRLFWINLVAEIYGPFDINLAALVAPSTSYHESRTFSMALATIFGCVINTSWPPSISTTSHPTPELSMNICCPSGGNVVSRPVLKYTLRPSSDSSVQSGFLTGVFNAFQECGRWFFANLSA